MIVIILAVYKSCNKNRENEVRRDINGTYAHIVDGHETRYSYNSGLFPPPPPPYGFVATLDPHQEEDAQSAATTTTTLPPGFKPEYDTSSLAATSTSNYNSTANWNNFPDGTSTSGAFLTRSK